MRPEWNSDMAAIIVALHTCGPMAPWSFMGDPLISLCEMGYVRVGKLARLTPAGRQIANLCALVPLNPKIR
jgi:hypothetical protein